MIISLAKSLTDPLAGIVTSPLDSILWNPVVQFAILLTVTFFSGLYFTIFGSTFFSTSFFSSVEVVEEGFLCVTGFVLF